MSAPGKNLLIPRYNIVVDIIHCPSISAYDTDVRLVIRVTLKHRLARY